MSYNQVSWLLSHHLAWMNCRDAGCVAVDGVDEEPNAHEVMNSRKHRPPAERTGLRGCAL